MADNRFNFEWKPEEGFSIPESVQKEERELIVEDEKREPFDGKLKQSDLMQGENLNAVRDYMVRRKGVQYNDMEPEEVVDDFVAQMRYFNTNLVSTGGEVSFITRGDDKDKAAAARAYKLYDDLGSVFVNDGFFGAVEGVGEYIGAAASDPSNYIGLLTGGIGKATAMGTTKASRALVKQAAKEAAERAIASGATREAADQAAKRASDRTIQRLAQRSVTGETAERMALRVADIERQAVSRRAGQRASKEVTDPLLKKAAKRSLYATTALDGTFAALNDYQIQNVMLDVGVQEEYSKQQTMLSSLLGLVGGGAQLAGRQATGVSGLGDSKIRLQDAVDRAQQEQLVRTAVSSEDIDKITDTFDKTLSRWEEKVQRGADEFGEINAPVDILYDVMLGPDGTGGLAKVMRDKGLRITRNRRVSDVMTDLVTQLPAEKLAEINARLEPMTGLTLGETTMMGTRLQDLFAKDINRAGKTLNVMSQVKKTINSGVVHGSNMMDAIARRDEELINVEQGRLQKLGNIGKYSQSVWRRMLVSSPATSMINVAGFSQFVVGQSVADMFNAGTLFMSGMARGGNLTAKGSEHLRMARVYSTIQAQKMRNFADPFTTYDTYMELLEQNEELKGRLFESFAGGIDRNVKRYNFDPDSKGVKVTESIVQASNNITGVTIQDTFTKSQMFIGELDKVLRLNKGKSLDEVMSTGTIDELFDDDVINPALDTTLKSVYSKNYTTDDQLLKDAAKLVEGISNVPVLGTVLPFGRFLNNTVATIYQWGPLSLLPTAARIAKKSADAGEKIMAREAFARSAVGTAALFVAMEFDKERMKQGLAYNEISTQTGTVIDAKNTFPFSFFLAVGRIGNLLVEGQSIPDELVLELGTQAAVGQAARDLQFGNDIVAVADSLFNFGADSGGYGELSKGAAKAFGNYTAGFTRPLDAVNKLVGYIDGSDAARDLRQTEGAADTFTQSSTRYVDNIFEAMFDRVEGVTGEELRVATREGSLYDGNILSRVFGVTVRPTRTATEQAYSMANMADWTASERSNIPQYDKIFNTIIAPRLNEEMDKLIRDERYKEGDTDTRKIMLEERLRRIKGDVREYMKVGGGDSESFILSMRRKANRAGNKEKRRMAMDAMRENFGYEGEGIKDMSVREMMYFMNYIDYLEVKLQ